MFHETIIQRYITGIPVTSKIRFINGTVRVSMIKIKAIPFARFNRAFENRL